MNTKGIGVEIEFTGVKRKDVVVALEGLFQSEAEEHKSKTTEDGYTYYKIDDNYGGVWSVKRDRSIKPQAYLYKVSDECADDKFTVVDLDPADKDYTEYMVEVVSPVISFYNLPLLFSVVDVIQSLGGLVNHTCGIHIHVDGSPIVEDLVVLFKKFIAEQDKILFDFQVKENRLERYCKKYDALVPLYDKYSSPDDFLGYLYYDHYKGDGEMRELRYYALNFYALKQHGTVEFRFFNSTLDKIELVKYIDWVLHFAYSPRDYVCYLPELGRILATLV